MADFGFMQDVNMRKQVQLVLKYIIRNAIKSTYSNLQRLQVSWKLQCVCVCGTDEIYHLKSASCFKHVLHTGRADRLYILLFTCTVRRYQKNLLNDSQIKRRRIMCCATFLKKLLIANEN
jgi:hypothetical protein